MRNQPICMMLEEGGWGLGCVGCLVALILGAVALFVPLPDIVPGPPILDTAVWLFGVIVLGAGSDHVVTVFIPDKVLELDGDTLRTRRGRRVEWERRLPPRSGVFLWHRVVPCEDVDPGDEEGREVDTGFLIIEIRSGMGQPLVMWRDVYEKQRDWAVSEFPKWQGSLPWEGKEYRRSHETGIYLGHWENEERMFSALLERAGVKPPK